MKTLFNSPHPLSIHCLLTTKCNFSCKECFYRKTDYAEIPIDKLLSLIDEWYNFGIRSIAFGGGEPFLYSNLIKAVDYAKGKGMYVAITTNGSIRLNFNTLPDRIHISYDSIHQELKFDELLKSILFFRLQGIESIGINHVIRSSQEFIPLDNGLKNITNNITILLEKPHSQFHNWKYIFKLQKVYPERYWIDACAMKCEKGKGCKQGFSSLSVNQNLEYSKCSNLDMKLKLPLAEAWDEIIHRQDCLYR